MTSKVLECGSIVPGCRFVIHGEDENEVIVKFAEHARSVHGVEHLSDALRARIRSAVKEDGGAASS
jgi:predicted small metal-binding protein